MLLSDVRCLTSVCLSVEYIGPNSRTERPRKTKIGTEVARVTRDSDTTFKVKRSKVKVTVAGHIVEASRTTCSTRYSYNSYKFSFVSNCLYKFFVFNFVHFYIANRLMH